MPARGSTTAAAIPPPNVSHPCASQVSHALARGHPHASSYHSFLRSAYGSDGGQGGTKRKGKQNQQHALPVLVDRPLDASVLHGKLLAWFDTKKDTRGMPWRKEVDPAKLSQKERSQRGYEVWVSEIMLQQTQVATVISYYKRWMEKMPTVAALANADPELVNECWKGLGYYSRATRLQAGAKKVVGEFDGRVPETVDELLQVYGIGPYSAGAISSIAFARRSPMVDGNIQRVLSRLTALHAPATAKPTTNFIWALADVLVPAQPIRDDDDDKKASARVGGPNTPGAWNQALMELGATVCTPKNPKCTECPLSEECLAFAEVRLASSKKRLEPASVDIEDLCTLCAPIDDLKPSEHSVTVYPMAKERKKPREEETAVCVLEWRRTGATNKDGHKVLLVKRPEKGLLAGLYEFPAVDIPPSDALSTSASRRKLLRALVAQLVAEPIDFDSSADAKPQRIRAASTKDLPVVTQVYSHQIRTYSAIRLVLESDSLPRLRMDSRLERASTDEDALVQSLVGRGKWVDEIDVAGANTGGAVGKIWDERERARKGLPPATNGAKAAFKTKPAARPTNGGSTLDAWMKKPASGSATAKPSKAKEVEPAHKKRRITKDGYETEESDDGEVQVVVVDEPEREKPFVPSGKYKKRTIAAASDDDEDE